MRNCILNIKGKLNSRPCTNVIALLMVVLLTSCDYITHFTIHNETPDELVLFYWYEDADTNILSGRNYSNDHPKNHITVSPFSQETEMYLFLTKHLFCNADTLRAFIVNADTLSKYGLEGIAARRSWLHRYDVTEKEWGGYLNLYYPVFPSSSQQ